MPTYPLTDFAHHRRTNAALLTGLLLAALLFAMPIAQAQAQQKDASAFGLETYSSKHYTIHTNMNEKDVRLLGKHMDRVFTEYDRRFKIAEISARNEEPMALYMLRTREDYLQFLSKVGIQSPNSGGIFFVKSDVQGLATYVEDRNPTELKSVMQHEGFHQFAYQYIGRELPIWVNEGIAEYFDGGIMIRNKFVLNLASSYRIAVIQEAVKRNRYVPFDKMLSMSGQEWGNILSNNPDAGSLNYAQAWSMVHYLITGERGRLLKKFETYLKLVAKETPSAEAFETAFGKDSAENFEKSWREFVMQLEPDPISAAAERLSFQAYGLRWIHENQPNPPATAEHLKHAMQRVNYRVYQTAGMARIEVSAKDDKNFYYNAGNRERMFRMLPPERRDLPPRLTAEYMRPTPTLVWYRDDQGRLVDDILWQ